jgi:hypothetical protein
MNTLVAIRKTSISAAIITALALAPVSGFTSGDRHHPPTHITIHGPNSGNFQGLTTTTGWSLMLRIEVPDSVAIVESPEEPTQPVGRREAVVFQDPDGCIDMRHFPIINAGTPYEDCKGPDESFIEFTTERFDNFDVADSNTGNFQVRDILVDDVFATGALLNKPFLRNTAGSIVAVPRPQTGGVLKDGFGYGPDDDLPGLVVMANIGAARAFDENFDATQGKVIRNMGGFINSVSQELLTRRGGSAITAWMQVIAGMFEPIALFDLDVDAEGVDYLRRLESGPVQVFQFVAPPQNDDDILFDITSTYGPFELDLRVVLVEGVAPTFIHDKNGDGRFTAADLRRMGFTILSNEARLRLREDFDVLVTETVTGRTCPPPSLIYFDLDGNGADGAITCGGSGGATRIRRKPQ